MKFDRTKRYIGGYGIFVEVHVKLAQYISPLLSQTNHMAELIAVTVLLALLPSSDLAVCEPRNG